MDRIERAEKFRKVLKKRETTCHEVSLQIGVSKQSLYFILRAKVTPSVETILLLEAHLKLKKGTLL